MKIFELSNVKKIRVESDIVDCGLNDVEFTEEVAPACDGGWDYGAGVNYKDGDGSGKLAYIEIASYQNCNDFFDVELEKATGSEGGILNGEKDFRLRLVIRGVSECDAFADMLRDIADKIDRSEHKKTANE